VQVSVEGRNEDFGCLLRGNDDQGNTAIASIELMVGVGAMAEGINP